MGGIQGDITEVLTLALQETVDIHNQMRTLAGLLLYSQTSQLLHTQTNENVSSLDSELTALQGTVTGNKSELDGKIASLQSSLTAHTGNNTIHVTQADKNKWNENSITAGSVWLWPGNTPPAGWLLCNGQAVSRATYANLFSVLGTAYGQGNGSTTFNVPAAV